MSTDLVLGALAWLGTYLVHSTLLLGAVALVACKLKTRHPRLLERLWKVAALGSLVTASVQVSLISDPILGRLSLRSLVAAAPAVASSSPGPIVAEEGEATPPRRTTRRSARPLTQPSSPPREASPAPRERRAAERPLQPVQPDRPEEGPDEGEREEPAVLASASPSKPSKPLPWKPAAVATWAIVGGWGLLGFLIAWSRLFARLSDRRLLKSGLAFDRLAELRRRAGVKPRIRLSASSAIDSPITHGWFRREICLPERALTELSPGQLETTLAHELAHVVRRDPLWFGILALLERVLFFQPLNRAARKNLQDIAEFVCDDQAVRWTGSQLALASALTEIAHWVVGRRQLALPSPGMASSRLGDRVERLLDQRHDPEPEPRRAWLPPTALGALGLVVFAVPGVSSAAPISAGAAREPEPAELHGLADETPREPARTVQHSQLGLRMDEELLDQELLLLRSELEQLRAELDESELYDRFEHAFEGIERRMEDLRSRKERLDALLSRMHAEGETHLDTQKDGFPR